MRCPGRGFSEAVVAIPLRLPRRVSGEFEDLFGRCVNGTSGFYDALFSHASTVSPSRQLNQVHQLLVTALGTPADACIDEVIDFAIKNFIGVAFFVAGP